MDSHQHKAAPDEIRMLGWLPNPWRTVSVVFLIWVAWVSLHAIYVQFPEGPAQRVDFLVRLYRQSIAWLPWLFLGPYTVWIAKLIYNNGNVQFRVTVFVAGYVVLTLARTTILAFVRVLEQSEYSFLYIFKIRLLTFAILDFLLFVIIVVAYFALRRGSLYEKAQLEKMQLKLRSEQLEKKLSESQLATLRMQLNPHFLFNTLHSIASLIRTKKNHQAITVLSQLSDLLRDTVYNNSPELVTVEQELGLIQRYLSIEKVRFEDRLHIEYDIDMSARQLVMPNFILQPIIENALKHGLKNVECGKLRVAIHDRDDFISIIIWDNGTGVPANGAFPKGVGLTNTLSRLRAHYENNFTFSIENNLDGSGACVIMRLPKRHE